MAIFHMENDNQPWDLLGHNFGETDTSDTVSY